MTFDDIRRAIQDTQGFFLCRAGRLLRPDHDVIIAIDMVAVGCERPPHRSLLRGRR